MGSPADRAFPRLRWLGASWLLVYLPAYTLAYGAANFLFLCNIGVIVTAVGLIVRDRLLVSSQAVAAPVIAWSGRWMRVGGWPRVNSCSEARAICGTRGLPAIHTSAVAVPRRLASVAGPGVAPHRLRPPRLGPAGSDSGIGGGGRTLAGPTGGKHHNAWQDPFFGQQFGPAPVHLLVSWAALAGIAYGATHWLLKRWFRP